MAKSKGLSHSDSERLLNLVRHAVDHFNLYEKVRQELIDAADIYSRKDELPGLLEDFRRYKQEHKLDMGELECCLEELTNKLY